MAMRSILILSFGIASLVFLMIVEIKIEVLIAQVLNPLTEATIYS